MRAPWTTREVAILSSGLSIRELCRVLGRDEHVIYSAAKRNGANIARSTRSDIYAEDVAQMMMLRESGWKWSDIAKTKGITASHARMIYSRAKKYGFDKYPKRVVD